MRRKRKVVAPGDILGDDLFAMGVKEQQLPADQKPVGDCAGSGDQKESMAGDTGADDSAASAARETSRPGGSGAGQADDQRICPGCESRAGRKWGQYRLSCLECCVTLVESTRPNKKAANGMLWCIEKHRSFTREQMLDEIRRRQE